MRWPVYEERRIGPSVLNFGGTRIAVRSASWRTRWLRADVQRSLRFLAGGRRTDFARVEADVARLDASRAILFWQYLGI